MKLRLAPAIVLAATLLVCESASAQNEGKPLKGLIQQRPVFDTSVFPIRSTPFKLNIERRQILSTQDPGKMLRAKTAILTGGANGQLLKGGVTQAEVRTPILTRERGVRSEGPFHLDLSQLIPKIAPDIAFKLNTSMEQAHKRLAARIAEQKPLMDQQLQARRPQPAMPIAPRPTGNVGVPAQVLAPQVPSIDQPQSPRINGVDLQAQLDRARRGAVDMPGSPKGQGTAMPGGGAQTVAIIPGAGGASVGVAMPQAPRGQVAGDLFAPKSSATTDIALLKRANEAMQAQLLASKKLPAVDVNGKMLDAKKRMDQFAKEVEPQLAAINTQIRRLPPNSIDPLTAMANLGPERVGDKVISWDPWHARFAKSAADLILKRVNSAGGPVGTNTVAITVGADHRITVKLEKGGSAAFDKAILQAYKGLDGSSSLAFPAGSLRKSISFLVDNKHESKGNAAVVNSVTSVGDKEVHRF